MVQVLKETPYALGSSNCLGGAATLGDSDPPVDQRERCRAIHCPVDEEASSRNLQIVIL